MGMGYGANYVDVISLDALRKLIPDAVKKFQSAMDDAKMDFDTFCQIMQDAESGGDNPNYDSGQKMIARNAMKSLAAAFKKATKVGKSGLTLWAQYHSQADEGDRYDDVDGGFFSVDEMYCLTPAGKKIHKMVERKFFVTFG